MEIGEGFQIPKEPGCGHKGKIVWKSSDGKTVGVRCPRYHAADPIDGTRYRGHIKDGYSRKQVYMARKDLILLIDVSDLSRG